MYMRVLIIVLLFLIIWIFLYNFRLNNEYKNLEIKNSENFSNLSNIFLLKNKGNNLCLFSDKEKDIFNKNQDLLIGKCNTANKKFHWQINLLKKPIKLI